MDMLTISRHSNSDGMATSVQWNGRQNKS